MNRSTCYRGIKYSFFEVAVLSVGSLSIACNVFLFCLPTGTESALLSPKMKSALGNPFQQQQQKRLFPTWGYSKCHLIFMDIPRCVWVCSCVLLSEWQNGNLGDALFYRHTDFWFSLYTLRFSKVHHPPTLLAISKADSHYHCYNTSGHSGARKGILNWARGRYCKRAQTVLSRNRHTTTLFHVRM